MKESLIIYIIINTHFLNVYLVILFFIVIFFNNYASPLVFEFSDSSFYSLGLGFVIIFLAFIDCISLTYDLALSSSFRVGLPLFGCF